MHSYCPNFLSFCFVQCCLFTYPDYAILWYLNLILHLIELCMQLCFFLDLCNPHIFLFSKALPIINYLIHIQIFMSWLISLLEQLNINVLKGLFLMPVCRSCVSFWFCTFHVVLLLYDILIIDWLIDWLIDTIWLHDDIPMGRSLVRHRMRGRLLLTCLLIKSCFKLLSFMTGAWHSSCEKHSFVSYHKDDMCIWFVLHN